MEVKFKHQQYPVLVNPSNVPELSCVQDLPEGIALGAAVTLSTVEQRLRAALEREPGGWSRSQVGGAGNRWVEAP